MANHDAVKCEGHKLQFLIPLKCGDRNENGSWHAPKVRMRWASLFLNRWVHGTMNGRQSWVWNVLEYSSADNETLTVGLPHILLLLVGTQEREQAYVGEGTGQFHLKTVKFSATALNRGNRGKSGQHNHTISKLSRILCLPAATNLKMSHYTGRIVGLSLLLGNNRGAVT